MDANDARTLLNLALGRLFRLLSRPSAPGDVGTYERCRALALDACEVLGIRDTDRAPNWARDRAKGAPGD